MLFGGKPRPQNGSGPVAEDLPARLLANDPAAIAIVARWASDITRNRANRRPTHSERTKRTTDHGANGAP